MLPDEESAELEALMQFMYLAPIGLAQIDGDGVVEMVNPMCAQLLMPLAPDGSLENIFDTLDTAAPELRGMVAQFTASHGAICRDHRIALPPVRGRDEHPQVLAISLIRLDSVRIMALLSDVSDAVRREKLLREKDEWHRASLELAREAAEAASRAKSEFLANMSHELRTPMHAISGFAKLGLRNTDEAPREKLLRYFSNIDNSAGRLNRLLNDLLDLAKIEAGKMTYTLGRHDVGALLRSIVDEFEAMAHDRQVILEVLPDAPAIAAEVDDVRIRQVFSNVLSNAIKFSPPGGKVTMRIARERDEQGTERLVIVFADQGPGVPPGELQLIFDKFVQSSKTKTGAGGTGLGLPISREILIAHGGGISATNRPQGGAEFRLTIPLVR